MIRHWVGGNGNWDDTAHWSATLGGSGGESVPTSADDVIISTNVTINVANSRNAVCHDLTFAIGTTISLGTSMYSDNITIYGSLDMAGRWGFGSRIAKATMVATDTGHTIKAFAGFTNPAIDLLILNGVGGEWTLQSVIGSASSASSPTAKIQLVAGSLITANYDIYCTYFDCSGTGVRSLTLGSSHIYIFGHTSQNKADFSGSNLTLNAGTSHISMGTLTYFYETGNSNGMFIGNGNTFYDITLNANAGGTMTVTGSNTYHDLEIISTGYSSGSTITSYKMTLVMNDNQTVNGTFIATGKNTATEQTRIYYVPASPVTITAAATSLTHVDFKNIIGAGTAAWTGTSVGDQGGNIGITFSTPRTVYFIGGANHGYSNYLAYSSFSLSSGGAGGQEFPLPQDSVIFDANSGFTADNEPLYLGYTGISQIGASLLFDGMTFKPKLFSWNYSSSQIMPTVAGTVTFNSSVNIVDVNMTMDDLIFGAGTTIYGDHAYLTTTSFTSNGEEGNLITINGLDTYSYRITADSVDISYVQVHNNVALGDAVPFNALEGGVDNGGNTGWLFPNPPVADFEADVVSGENPLAVQFTDLSTNAPTSWLWDFKNDGIDTSTEQNPIYVYEVPGTYTVKLTATNEFGSDDEIKTEYITVTIQAYQQQFNAGTEGILAIAPPRGTKFNPTFDGSAITATRIYTLRDKAGIVVLQAIEFTTGRITFVDADGNLIDDANLSYDGSFLYVNGIKVSSLTSGRVALIGTDGQIQDSDQVQWDGNYFIIPDIKITNLTPDMLVSVGAEGLLQTILAITNYVGYPGEDTNIPTEKAVRDAIQAAGVELLTLIVCHNNNVVCHNDEVVFVGET